LEEYVLSKGVELNRNNIPILQKEAERIVLQRNLMTVVNAMATDMASKLLEAQVGGKANLKPGASPNPGSNPQRKVVSNRDENIWFR
jgi:hypothetical protein